MTLKEAIEKAGEGGKITRPDFDGNAIFIRYDGYLRWDGQASNYQPLKHHLTATDWEVIEEKPVIEVGDTVRSIDCGGEAVVIGVNDKHIAYQYTGETGRTINLSLLERVRLIRKGPKVHRFEGVEFREVSNEKVVVPWGGFSQMYDDRTKFLDKTYDMTLTERPE